MQPEASELSGVDVLDERLVCGGGDAAVQDATGRSGVGRGVELGTMLGAPDVSIRSAALKIEQVPL